MILLFIDILWFFRDANGGAHFPNVEKKEKNQIGIFCDANGGTHFPNVEKKSS